MVKGDYTDRAHGKKRRDEAISIFRPRKSEPRNDNLNHESADARRRVTLAIWQGMA
jgi:hypothetical protein